MTTNGTTTNGTTVNGTTSHKKDDSETLKLLLSQVSADPQVPVPNPTASIWQEQLHPLHDTQSKTLPKRATYAIIGSGVTGCSLAKTLLDDPRSGSEQVVVLEARTLCSGATGRNGGHLVSPIPGEFSKLAAAYGVEMAVKIAKFNDDTLEKMHKLAANSDPTTKEAAEVRRVKSVYAFTDQALLDECRESIEMYMKHVPDQEDSHRFVDAKECSEKFGFKDCVGAVEEPAGAFWPYRLITGTFGSLVSKYSERFSLETQTPATQISSSGNFSYPYLVETPRGSIEAKHVIHCTNGHASHLLPALRGSIYPLRGTMSAQAPKVDFPQSGQDYSWSLQKPSLYDAQSKVFEFGLYYITQNAKTADVYIGGEKQDLREVFTSNDSEIGATAKQNIANILPKIFDDYENKQLRGIWSGVLGFTTDFLPLIDRLSDEFADQYDGDGGQWIAAGFNGYGMPQCWGAGEGVAHMILSGGKSAEFSENLPQVFKVTKERFGSEDPARSSLTNMFEMLSLDLSDL